MKNKIAKYISTIGHPLLTIPIFIIIALFRYEDFQSALLTSVLIIGGIILPLTIKMYKGSKNGKYTNFDISNRMQRQSLYLFVLFLLLLVTAILFITDQPRAIRMTTLLSLLLLIVSKLLNFYIKSSLHTSINIFLSFLIIPLNSVIGIVFLGFVPFIAWSRLELGRHTMREVISGAIIGGVIGFMSLFLVSGYGHNLFGNTNYIYTIPKNYHDGIKTDALHSVGIDSTKIIELTELILADSFPNIHSLLIAKDNKLLYENYFGGTDEVYGRQLGYTQHSMGDLHDCRSISKSVTSACIGIAVKNGLIKNVDEPIFSYFKEYEKYFDTIKRKITIRHLLTMTSGFDWNEDVSYRDPQNSELKMDMSTDPIEYILSQPIVAEPGTRWNYNGGGTQLLAEILKIVSGEKVDKFAEKHLFSPLNIQKYEWLTIKKNMPAAASGLRLASRDILKIALLYMNNGSWYETKIFTPEWAQISLSENVKRPSTRTMSGGYGYQFWTYTDTINTKPLKIAEAKGNGGQHIFFCRELNLIVVTTAGNYNQWNVNNNPHKALIQYIIPAIKN